jgi:phosphoribosyl 1,2-cyclic phosphodiesterase
MKCLCSFTGSDGNASIITDGKTTLQIDAGINASKVNKASGYKLSEVSAILLTHKHCDHTAFVNDYLRLGMKVYALNETWLETPVNGSKRNCKNFEYGKQFQVGTFIIKPFKVEHCDSDSEPCPNAGFFIYSTVDKEKGIWCTDCSVIENKFPPLDWIAIECNYIDVDDYSDELDTVNAFVEKRRFNSHLSLNRCIQFLKKQDLSKCKQIRLLHLSKQQGKIEETIIARMHNEFSDMDFVI